MAKRKRLTKAKAREILRDKTAHGRTLTKKQQAFFGFIAGGGKPTKTKRKK